MRTKTDRRLNHITRIAGLVTILVLLVTMAPMAGASPAAAADPPPQPVVRVYSNPPTGVTGTTATIHGVLAYLANAPSINMWFQWGPTTAYGNEIAGPVLTRTDTLSATLTGLTEGNTYHFRARGTILGVGDYNGDDITFVARAETGGITYVVTTPATGITDTTATLNGTLAVKGDVASVQAYFEWGTSTVYGNTTSKQTLTATAPFSASLIGLTKGTVYHYRAKADGGTAGTVQGLDTWLTTTGGQNPSPLFAFISARDGNDEVYTMTPQGGDQTRRTTNTVREAWPQFNMIWDKIIFTSWRDGNAEVYAMQRDGSGVVRLTNNAAFDGMASWSPDGSRVVFVSERDGNQEIYTMRADGSNVTRLTTDPGHDINPAWSYNGTKIAFASDRDGDYEIYTMNSTGGAATKLTDNSATDWYPTWLVGDSKIAFASNRNGNFDIFEMAANGSGQTAVVSGPSNDDQPVWCPSGGAIFFTSDRDGRYEVYALYLMPTGPVQQRLTNVAGGNWSRASVADVPPALAVATSAATNVTTTAAVLNGNLVNLGGAASVAVSFELGTATGVYDKTTAAQTRTATGAFSANITGLTAGTAYFFRAKAVGSTTAYGAETRFTAGAVAPTVSTSAATGISLTGATLNGNLTAMGSATSVDVSFDYGPSQSYGSSTEARAKTATGAFSEALTGLAAHATYYFRAKADAGAHGSATGQQMRFNTTSGAPVVSTDDASNVNALNATLNGELEDMGAAESALVSFEFGTTAALGRSTVPVTMSTLGAFNANLAGLVPNTTYHFRARAMVGSTIARGEIKTFTTLPPPPAAPALLEPVAGALISTQTPNLTWNAVSGAVSYRVQVSKTAQFATMVFDQAGIDGTSQQVGALTWNTVYFWRASATNSQGSTSLWCLPRIFRTGLGPHPAAPTNLTATAPAINRVNLTWDDDSSNELGFRIERKTGTGVWATIGVVRADVKAFTNLGCRYGSDYSYRVRAYGASGMSEYSNEATVTMPSPAPPSITSPTGGEKWAAGSTHNITWEPNGLTGTVRIELSRDGATWVTIGVAAAGTGSRSWLVTGAAAENARIRVSSVNYPGVADTSESFDIVAPPPVPVLVSPAPGAVVSSLRPELDWNASADAVNYRVQVSTSAAFTGTVVNEEETDTSYTVGEGILNRGTVYYWRACAVNADGVASAWSAARYFRTPST